MNRIEKTFQDLDRAAFISFIMASDPDGQTCLEVMKSLPDAGVDIIELGMPFTDPVADGPTIQTAGLRALDAGANMSSTLQIVRDFRGGNTETPIILMGYLNPVLQFGQEEFFLQAQDAGVDGLILVDLPPEEARDIQNLASRYHIHLIRLITPTTTEERLSVLLDGASGFLYYVSVAGITGSASANPVSVKPHLEIIKRHTDLPVAVGFGIKNPHDVAAMAEIADAVVVGSAIVEMLHQQPQGVFAFVKNLSTALSNNSPV